MTKKNSLKGYLAIGSLSANLVLKNLPFVIFLAFLTVVYIANAHFSERTVREIQGLQKDIKELRWKYMAITSENMYNSMRTEVEKKVSSSGLKSEGNNLPQRVKVNR
jgi:hypothetical protein